MKGNVIVVFFQIILLYEITAFAAHQPPLEGKWSENADLKSILEITKTKYIETYNGKIIYSGKYYRMNHSCDSTYLKDTESGKFDFISLEDGRCFEIIGLTSNNITIRYSASGKLHMYHKLKQAYY